jgi:hypothetical protein
MANIKDALELVVEGIFIPERFAFPFNWVSSGGVDATFSHQNDSLLLLMTGADHDRLMPIRNDLV